MCQTFFALYESPVFSHYSAFGYFDYVACVVVAYATELVLLCVFVKENIALLLFSRAFTLRSQTYSFEYNVLYLIMDAL